MASLTDVLRRRVTGVLDLLLNKQERAQRAVYGHDPGALKGEQLIEYIRLNVLAATDELHEVLRETGWKTWRKEDYGFVNRARYIDELADVLLFFLNLCLAQRVTGRELAVALAKKWRLNASRQKAGY
jgi:hypothetical protein